jgi:UDP-2-acetamido-3-amino-2,3-dideoxy-glucuronate N-acetyltransferase
MANDIGLFIHANAVVESGEVGPGTRIWAFAHVMSGAVVGRDCNIGNGSFIETGAVVGDRVTIKNNSLIWHGVNIADDVFVGPNTVFTNDPTPRAHQPSDPAGWLETFVENGASIGANSTILCGIVVGAHSMIGAGSVVIRSVPPYGLMVGNPARRIGWVCVCGSRLPDEMVCGACDRKYSLVGESVEEVSGG